MPILNIKQNNKLMLDTYLANGYNKIRAEVAQSVEQRTENPRVPSSILGLGTKLKSESGLAVDHLLAKVKAASLNPVFCSI